MMWLRLGIPAVCAAIAVYTASYARWEWVHGNRTGAAAVYLLAAAAIALPLVQLVL